jgi:hypothetical protein
MPEQTLASSKSFNDDSIQKMFFTQALQPASPDGLKKASEIFWRAGMR